MALKSGAEQVGVFTMGRVTGIKSKNLKRLAAAAVAMSVFALPQAASASLVYDESILITGQGFGNNPRLLTEQENGNGDDIESACVSAGSGGSIGFGSGSCISDSDVFKGNGFSNFGGDEVNPQGDNHKYGIPTIGEMGFEDASDIGILFNATEPGGDGLSIDDLTLKFYQDGNLVAAIDGSHEFGNTEQGNGRAGFVFVVDQEQQDYLNEAVFGLPDFSDIRIALEATISDAQGGPESFLAVNLGRSSSGGSTGSTGGTPVPAPAGLGLFALAAAGLVTRRRRRG